VEHETNSPLLGALAFSIGFIALILAGSELFTENFLVPVVAVAAGRARVTALLRLWAGTLVTNLLGGFVLTGLFIAALPELRATAVKLGRHYIELPTREALAAAISAGFLLAGATLNHAIVVSLLVFAALHARAPFGYLDWLRTLGLAITGNMIGGLGLVTLLRLVQVGRQRVAEVSASGPSADDRG
jgi:formate/nitrite transporter FocA (FNT family)